MQYLLVFRSLTYAQRGAKLLERAGVTAVVGKVPKHLSPKGCSYGIRLPERHYPRAISLLKGGGLMPERVYRQFPDGSAEEVFG